MSSRLEQIKGVGPKTRIKLLKQFGSLRHIEEASLEEIEALGISAKVAKAVKLSLRNVQ